MQLFSHQITREIVCDIKSKSGQFSIIMDSTADVSAVSQECLCIRYVDSDLNIHEHFIGLYEASNQTGVAIASLLKDSLIRLDLSIEDLQFQAYDGASNMSGIHNGCQSLISQSQPLAYYVHCGAHILNLINESTIKANAAVKDAINVIQELSSLSNRSSKVKEIVKQCCVSSNQHFKPLCPTRWLYKISSISSAVVNIKEILQALERLTDEANVDTASKANGILNRLEM